MPTKRIRYFLIGLGSLLLIGSGVRFYRLIRTHAEDYFFAPHLLLTSLSLFLSWVVIKVGLRQREATRRDAISLIRSGSVLAMIWGYRLYLLLFATDEPGVKNAYGLAMLYVVLGTFVMCVGLKISRAIRKGESAASREWTVPVGSGNKEGT